MPNKNRLLANGIPLVRRTVELARACGFFDEIVLSTESREVLEASSSEKGEDVLWHPRPDSLCQPKSSVWDAVRHYHKAKHDYIMLLHPTSPCLRPETVQDAFETMIDMESAVDALVSVSKSNPYSWSVAEPNPKFYTVLGTQFAVPRLELNNAVYIAKWDRLLEVKNGYELKWTPYAIEDDEAIDIDTETDLMIAEAVLQWRDRNEETKQPPSANL